MAGLAGCDAETLLEGRREVRDVLEANIEASIRDAAATLEQIKGCAQTTICEPTLGGQVAHFLEIPLKGGQAASGGTCKFAHRHITPEILLHEFFQVDFLSLRLVGCGVRHRLR